MANYPYDESRNPTNPTEYSVSPDDTTFRHLALNYAGNHPEMSDPKRYPKKKSYLFQKGNLLFQGYHLMILIRSRRKLN